MQPEEEVKDVEKKKKKKRDANEGIVVAVDQNDVGGKKRKRDLQLERKPKESWTLLLLLPILPVDDDCGRKRIEYQLKTMKMLLLRMRDEKKRLKKKSWEMSLDSQTNLQKDSDLIEYSLLLLKRMLLLYLFPLQLH